MSFRWRALHCALKWIQSTISNSPQNEFLSQADKVEREMWKCCVSGDDPAIYVSQIIMVFLCIIVKLLFIKKKLFLLECLSRGAAKFFIE